MPDDWIERMKQTLALDLSRGMSQGLPPKALINLLFNIPEVEQAFQLRARAVMDRNGNWRLTD